MTKENEKGEKLICVLCGHVWGLFNNVCEDFECGGFCTWGYELGKPLSYTIDNAGKWHLNKAKTLNDPS